MDLRSIKPGLSAVSHPLFKIHPLTGEMIVPMSYTKTGRPIWPMMGGAPEEGEGGGEKDEDKGGSEDEDEEDDDDPDNDEDDDEDDDEGDDGKGKKKGNAQAKIKALEEEKDRHFRKARKANKRAEKAEAELAALRAKYESGSTGDKGGKDDKDEKPVDDSKIKAAEAKAQRLVIENAFLRVNDVAWIKPEQALALMLSDDDYEIEFDDDGKVDRKSLRAELKRFAKANAHLVKKPAAKDDEEDVDDGSSSQRQTAPQMNGKRKGKTKAAPTREELAKRFPALNRLGS